VLASTRTYASIIFEGEIQQEIESDREAKRRWITKVRESK
jgi:hypothetical protein